MNWITMMLGLLGQQQGMKTGVEGAGGQTMFKQKGKDGEYYAAPSQSQQMIASLFGGNKDQSQSQSQPQPNQPVRSSQHQNFLSFFMR